METMYSHLEWAHPIVREWFVNKFGSATEPQELGWPHILSGRTTLISAPTGSGKTLAAFLACIDNLVRRALDNQLSNVTEVVYISPLKALSNDIQKNLELPLKEISQLANERGFKMADIRVAVRTGDTPMSERQSMLKKPPHILVTTPESFYILLTAEKSRVMLRSTQTVIVDEIHAVVDDKRGAHLAISLERLDALTDKKPTRIGLSATQKPIEIVGQFLAGSYAPPPVIVNIGHKRTLDIAVEVPEVPLGPIVSNEIWENTYKRITELVNEHRSTLVFVNTRKHAERVAMSLTNLLGEDAVATHHGSLARKTRLAAERKLKNGEIKVLVATASLELGIDIGSVDLVCQISSPRSIATALQRIGRAGHWRGAIPKGRLFAMTRDELIESAAIVRAIQHGDLDQLIIPDTPLDILAQQIVAICAAEDWKEDDLFALIRGAYPYRELERDQFDRIITMLSEGIAGSRGRYGAYLMRDQVNSRLKGRRGARLAAITSGGAIPESNLYSVVVEPEGNTIGTLDEDFAIESHKGDIILLGNSSWRVRRVENKSGRVVVDDAHGAPPTVPFWLGEAPARTAELSDHIGELRKIVSDQTIGLQPTLQLKETSQAAQAIAWLQSECGLNTAGAEQIVEYIVEGRAILGAIPTKTTIIAERFFDEGGGMQLVIHAPFGGKINKAWGLALRKKFCRSFNFELQAAATDNGLNIALAEQHSFPLADVFYYVTRTNVRHTLEQASLQAPVFGTRWRWDAMRSLALLRFMGGKKVPPYLQRIRSEDLLAAVFPDAAACQDNIGGDIELPDHPLVQEVMKDVLFEAMDLAGLEDVLSGIANSSIECIAIDTAMPSAFSHEILNANPYAYLDDAPLEERRARAVEMRRVLPDTVVREVGQLDQAAIEQVRMEAWPDIRDADELHDFLLTVTALPETLNGAFQQEPREDWAEFFETLRLDRRASRARYGDKTFWVVAERARAFRIAFPTAKFEDKLPDVKGDEQSSERAILGIIQGWMSVSGPMLGTDLESLLSLSLRDIDLSLLQLESKGSVLRGSFTNRIPIGSSQDSASCEWCDRRLLARIHLLTVSTLRKQVEPVTSALFMRWLAHWQHVVPGSQLTGQRGLLEVLQQLQGFEIPANAWERQVLAKRVVDYDPKALDQLCLTGAVGWGRLSPHPAALVTELNNIKAAGKGSRSKKYGGINGSNGLNSTNGSNGSTESHRNNGSNDVSKDEQLLSDKTDLIRQGRRVVPTSVAPITFFVREDADWLGAQHPQADSRQELSLSSSAKAVKLFLTQRGASFFADVVRGTGILKAEVETGLWELVTAGIVTADGFDNLRALIDPHRRSGTGRARNSRPRHSTGRWSLLYTEDTHNKQKTLEAICRVLLHRYGVVFREILVRETNLPKWRELLYCFRLLEDRGEVRGGRFISGFIGEQFALPEALDSLRLMRKREPNNYDLVLSAADPLNLIGIVLPGEKVPALSGKVFKLPI
jgi:ATP-dependent helicase Lhr and Lhr-like helicase